MRVCFTCNFRPCHIYLPVLVCLRITTQSSAICNHSDWNMLDAAAACQKFINGFRPAGNHWRLDQIGVRSSERSGCSRLAGNSNCDGPALATWLCCRRRLLDLWLARFIYPVLIFYPAVFGHAFLAVAVAVILGDRLFWRTTWAARAAFQFCRHHSPSRCRHCDQPTNTSSNAKIAIVIIAHVIKISITQAPVRCAATTAQ